MEMEGAIWEGSQECIARETPRVSRVHGIWKNTQVQVRAHLAERGMGGHAGNGVFVATNGTFTGMAVDTLILCCCLRY